MDIQVLFQEITNLVEKQECINEASIFTFFEFLPSDPFHKMSKFIIQTCIAFENTSALKEFCEVVNNTRQKLDPLPAPTIFFLNDLLTTDERQYVMKCFPTLDVSEHFIHIINMVDVESALKAANCMETDGYFTNYKDWKFLYELTDNVEEIEYHNPHLRDWLNKRMSSVDRKPNWVKEFSRQELPEIPILPSVQEAVTLLTDRLQGRIKITPVLRNGIACQYAMATLQDKIHLLREVKSLADFEGDDILIREFGPCNTQYTVNSELLSTKCSKYGGCRMLLCTEFETEEEDDVCSLHITNREWFRAECDMCHTKIDKEHYAVREPLSHGGWRGCYCSFQCMEKIPRINKGLLFSLKEQLEKYGLRDR